MKKCYSLLRWPCLLQDVPGQTFTVQNKLAAVAPKENHHPSFLRFWNWAEEKTVDAAKICGGAEMLLKQKPSKHS